jgi:hypothetical protein
MFLKFCWEFVDFHLKQYAGKKIFFLSLEGEEVGIFQQDVGLNPPSNFVISFKFLASRTSSDSW